MIGSAPRSNITGVPGWESEDEQAYLYQLAQDVPEGGLIVELGAQLGMSSSLFCKGSSPSVAIVSIDLFPGDMLEHHLHNLQEAELGGRSTQMRADSALAGKQWKLGPIDLLFVDGDHSYEGCKADIDAWVDHVKVGGRMVFHDVAQVSNRLPHEMHFYVTRSVSEWFWNTAGAWRHIRSVNTLMAFERLR